MTGCRCHTVGNGPACGLDFGQMAGHHYRDDVIDLLSHRSVGEPNAPTIETLAGTGIKVAGWSGSALTELSISREFQHDYEELLSIWPHVHWRPTTAGAGNVNWGFEIAVEYNGQALWTTTLTVSVAAGGVAGALKNTEFGELAVPATHAKIGAQISMRLFRDGAADTYADLVTTATFGNHYPVNTYGSRGRFTK